MLTLLFTPSFSAAANAVLFLHLTAAFGRGRWMFPAVPWFLLMGAVLYLYPHPGYGTTYNAALSQVEAVWLPCCLLMLFLFLVADVLCLAGKLCFPKGRKPGRRFYRRMAALIVGGSILFTGYSMYEAQTLTTRSLTLETDRLPEGRERLRIAFVTDIHINDWIGPRMVGKVADAVRRAEPDIILLGGDTVDADMATRTAELALLKNLQAPLGKYAVLGNHEVAYGMEQSLEFHRKAGFRVLRHEWVNTGGIIVAGVDDPTAARRSGRPTADPVPLLKKVPGNSLVLLLKHRPLAIPESLGLFDLQLSGHSHGGQVWPMGYLADRAFKAPTGVREYPSGGAQRENSVVYVSSGSGFTRVPMRFLTPPEIVVIDFVRAGAEEADS